MIRITTQVDNSNDLDEALLRSAAEAALRHENAVESAGLTLVITGDEALQRLNKQFLGIDAPTDVLSFPSDEMDPETGAPYLGDILISLPRTRKQARERSHALEAELVLLTVHGVLHLMGHDHAGPDEKTRMWAAQKTITDGLGFDVTPP